jgi:hypothetical protein
VFDDLLAPHENPTMMGRELQNHLLAEGPVVREE